MATVKKETKTTTKATKTTASRAAKTAAKAAPVTETEEKKAPEEGKAEAPANETKAAPVKKTAAKKAPVKKAAAPEAAVYVEYAGRQVAAKDVLEAAKAAFAKSHKDVEIKTIALYVKPEESVAYYVVNGEGSDDYKIEL